MLTRLPHRISIMTETRITFSGGCYTSTWTTFSMEWANCQIDNSNESTKELKKQQFNKWIIIMRKNANFSNKNRINFDNLLLHIESISDPTARNRMIEVTCREEYI